MEMRGEVQTSENTKSKGQVDFKDEAVKGNLCILLVEQALQGEANKAFEETGKRKQESILFRIEIAGWPKRECQSVKEVLTAEAKASNGGEEVYGLGHSYVPCQGLPSKRRAPVSKSLT